MPQAAQREPQLPPGTVELFAVGFSRHAEGELPRWAHICPAGELDDEGRRIVRGRDGRVFEVADPAAIIERTEMPMQFDWDHESVSWFGSTKAAGWMDRVEWLEEGDAERPAPGFWARVERWTPRGKDDIEAGYFRGLSPVVRYRMPDTGEDEEVEPVPLLHSFVNVALTNRPNLTMTLLNAEEPQQTRETPMSMKKLAKRLGLHADADADVVAQAAHDRMDQLVPAEELHRANAEIERLRADAERVAQERHQEAVDLALEEARKAGKISPASQEHFRAMCATPDGLARFEALAETLPCIVLDDPSVEHEERDRPNTAMTAEEREVAESMGLSDEEFLAHREKLKTRKGE